MTIFLEPSLEVRALPRKEGQMSRVRQVSDNPTGLYSVQCTVYSAQCTVHSTVYSVQCTVYSTKCRLYAAFLHAAARPQPFLAGHRADKLWDFPHFWTTQKTGAGAALDLAAGGGDFGAR